MQFGTWLSVLLFLFFIAPGIAYDLLKARRLPVSGESAFREAARVILFSTLFSGLAFGVLLALRATLPEVIPDLRLLFGRDSGRYIVGNYPAVLRTLAIQFALSLAAPLIVNYLLGLRSGGAQLKPISTWSQAFSRDCPDDCDTFARVRLTSGRVYIGKVILFSAQTELENRELVLAQPLSVADLDGTTTTLPDSWQRVIIKDSNIEVVSTLYRKKLQAEG